eukprot:gene5269-10541_t
MALNIEGAYFVLFIKLFFNVNDGFFLHIRRIIISDLKPCVSLVSVAALLLALCPRFPMRSHDHQYHLHALRHQVALAAEGRALQPLDVMTGRPVSIEILVKDGTQLPSQQALSLLPELSQDTHTVRFIHIS